jgi:hypothetical protein
MAEALEMLKARPHSGISLVKPLSGGRSGAHVFLCDLKDFDAGTTTLNGQFVLKVQNVPAPYHSSYQAFVDRYSKFGETHIPDLTFAFAEGEARIEIYDIAGFSLDTVRTLENVSKFDDRTIAASIASSRLLETQLDAQDDVEYGLHAHAVLQKWLGADFPSNSRGSRIAPVRALLGIAESDFTFSFEGELLPDPITVLGLWSKNIIGVLMGLSHGDLHPGNILVRGSFSANTGE